MIAPDQELGLSLTANECNVLFNVLNDAPYRIAAPLIDKLRRQILAIDPLAFDPPSQRPAPMNGVDHASN